jgi:PleD family two-component response regulator
VFVRSRRQFDIDVAEGRDPSSVPTSSLVIDVDMPEIPEVVAEDIMDRVAWVVAGTIRSSDVLYRHGENSFCVLLPATDPQKALVAERRVRRGLERAPIPPIAPVRVSVESTASIV